MMTSNRMLQPHLNTVNVLFNCCKTEQYFLLTWVLYGKILIVVKSNTDVWLRYIYYQCWKIHITSSLIVVLDHHDMVERLLMVWMLLKKVFFGVKYSCADAWCSSWWLNHVNSYLNFKHRHQRSKGISKTSLKPNTGTCLVGSRQGHKIFHSTEVEWAWV